MASSKSEKPRRASKSSRTGLVTYVVDGLRKLITQQALKAGDQLPTESVLIAQFQVSRTVVREAISRLQAAGSVNTKHGVGSFVATPDSERTADCSTRLAAALEEIGALKNKIVRLEAAVSRLETKRSAL